jgi:hypothetical protein
MEHLASYSFFFVGSDLSLRAHSPTVATSRTSQNPAYRSTSLPLFFAWEGHSAQVWKFAEKQNNDLYSNKAQAQ